MIRFLAIYGTLFLCRYFTCFRGNTMAWAIINPISADTESINSALLTQILDNLLASGANNVVATGDILYGLVDDLGERSLARLSLARGTRNTVVIVGNNSGIEWSGLGVNVDYSSYIREGIPVLDSEFVTETSGLTMIEVVQNRIPSNLLSAVVDSAQFEYESIANLGNLTPSVERYIAESAVLNVKSVSSSSAFTITTNSDGNYVWSFDDTNIHRLGFIVIGGTTGTSGYYVLDVVDGDRVPDFDLLPSNEGDNLGNRNKLSTTFEFSKSEIESLVADDSFVFEGYSTRSSLDAVIGLSVTSTVSSATLNWSPVIGASEYQVQYRQSSSETFIDIPTSPVSSNSAVVGGLLADTRYVYRVRALSDMAISGDWSDEVESATMTPTLGRVTGVAFTSYGENALTFSWSAVANATSYSVEYKPSTSDVWNSAGSTSSTSDTISSLQSNTSYNIRIKATAPGYVDGAWSFVVTGSTRAPRLATPNAPSLSLVDDVYVQISWNSVPNASSYRLDISSNPSGGPLPYVTVVGTSYKAGPFPTGDTVYAYVQARSSSSAYRDSLWSSTNSLSIPLPPPDPVKLPAPTLTVGRGSSPVRGRIVLSWSTVTNATHYKIRIKSSSSDDWVVDPVEYTGNSHTYEFDNDIYTPLPDWVVGFSVQAVGDSTTVPSDWSSTVSMNIYPSTAPPNTIFLNNMVATTTGFRTSSGFNRQTPPLPLVTDHEWQLRRDDRAWGRALKNESDGSITTNLSFSLATTPGATVNIDSNGNYTYSFRLTGGSTGEIMSITYELGYVNSEQFQCRIRNVPEIDSIYVVSDWVESDYASYLD